MNFILVTSVFFRLFGGRISKTDNSESLWIEWNLIVNCMSKRIKLAGWAKWRFKWWTVRWQGWRITCGNCLEGSSWWRNSSRSSSVSCSTSLEMVELNNPPQFIILNHQYSYKHYCMFSLSHCRRRFLGIRSRARWPKWLRDTKISYTPNSPFRNCNTDSVVVIWKFHNLKYGIYQQYQYSFSFGATSPTPTYSCVFVSSVCRWKWRIQWKWTWFKFFFFFESTKLSSKIPF